MLGALVDLRTTTKACVPALAQTMLTALVCVCVFRLVLHPLAGVPGPRLAALSNVWQAYHARSGRVHALARTLHRTYGPVVRVGPNEVWIDSREGFKAVYSAGSGFEKSDFYLATILQRPAVKLPLTPTRPDTLDLLSERDMRRYRIQRRLIGPTYHPSAVRKYLPSINSAVERVLAGLRSLDGRPVDLAEWMHISIVECLSAALVGGAWSPGLLRARSDRGSGAQNYLSWRRKSVLGLFPTAAVLAMVSRRFGEVFTAVWRLSSRPPVGFATFFPAVQKKVNRRIKGALAEGNGERFSAGAATSKARLTREGGGNAAQENLLDDLISLHLSKPDQFTEKYLRRMAMTNLGAGHETTTSALTAVFAMIGTHPAVQSRIVAEIRERRQPIDELSTEEMAPLASSSSFSSSALPYTLAVIKEAQRLHPAIGMSLSRVVPPGPGLRLHGHLLPAGTVVGAVPAALHRNRDIFGPDADDFRPERWLAEDPNVDANADADANAKNAHTNTDRIKDMERCNLVWGGGRRTCPGRHLAELAMWALVPAVVAKFRIVVVDMPATDEMDGYFLSMLTGIEVRFVEREGEKPRAARAARGG